MGAAASAMCLFFGHLFLTLLPILALIVLVFAVLWVWEASNDRHLPTTLKEMGDALTGRPSERDDE